MQRNIYIAAHDLDQRHPPRLPRLFREERPRAGAFGAAGAAERSDADVRQRRHGAVQERLHRPGDAALQHRDQLAEMRSRGRQAQRPRQCRLHRAPPHLLRNAREFLVRRLFQGPRDRARVEPADEGVGPQPGPADRHRLPHRRRGVRPVEEDLRPAREPDHPHPDQGQFLGDGRRRPVRALLGDLLRSRRAHPRRPAGTARTRTATASSRSGTSSSCSTSRRRARSSPSCRSKSIDTGMGLERIAAVLQGMHRQLRHRHVQGADRRQRGADPHQGRRRATRPATASSPTTCARAASSSPTACCPRTRAGAMSCAGSCAGRCAMRTCSAPRSR